ncbi:NADH dehydrogenase (quinone) [Magnetococcus marinus MC-1]|uniref:NADH dehydrogenase (Quinone) n=1 Tax=Magnetococcus marinus (strain ATCC BAA-1437 / JCM 17883 / MC-1) TaxID=156889 RepID=A0L9R8_MAGMM|nr:proton-conducting transporter membrane subunit [Magnetococcus marinus]ABK44711.1 NADH dehydrogenase (quinone) [Magnetococcus marinus MC-1]
MSPLYIIAVGLGGAFTLGFLNKNQRNTAYLITLAALACMGAVASEWLWAFSFLGASAVEIQTAGTVPPFAINLRMGMSEAALLTLITATGLLSALHMREVLLRVGQRGMAVLLIFVMGLSGIILTRDIFNLFVFFELVVIATGGLVLLSDDKRSLGAGFKYLIISQVITILMLVGITFIYHATGTLNIDGMSGASLQGGVDLAIMKGGAVAFFCLFIAVIAELKPFPANGWALDIYESAHPSFAALFSAASASAALIAVDKILLIGGAQWHLVATAVGIVTFVASNLFALTQTCDRRMLGYSSVAQVGLVLTVIGQKNLLGDNYLYVAGGILLAHGVGKAGLFWLSGLVAQRNLTAWSALRGHPLLIFSFVTFVALLTGLPPFPGFYAKWDLMHALAGNGKLVLMGMILFGALMEAGYLLRWFGYVLKREQPAEPVTHDLLKQGVVLVAALAGWALAYQWGSLSAHGNLLHALPLLFALSFLLLEWLPAWVKNSLAIAGMSYYFSQHFTEYDPLHLIFAAIILIGGVVTLLAGYHAHGRRVGFFPSVMLMFAGLIMLVTAKDSFNFFAAWELLTVGSYFLIMRGKESEPHALSYVLFSLGGAFLILAGFAIAAQGGQSMVLGALGGLPAAIAPWVFVLLAIGFMTKTASIGVHIWLPGAHAEAETDVSPMVSGILLKAGLFGFVVLLLNMGHQKILGVDLTHVLLWIGAFSALLGNLMAIFQEDAKRLLAYSSIGQMGYALFGLALMNHLGWLMALMFVINHYVYKSMLFLAVGGVAKRTGTRAMYQMGGLIKLMPLSFISVLVGIIAVSGLPPLSGFGGRWIFYNAILTAETQLPMVVLFLAGPIAFLYLFRLIHTIFLGQLKDEHRRLKEAPFWILVPQMIYVALLMVVALFPGMVLRRVDSFLGGYFPDQGLHWGEGTLITSQFGYWNPIAIMVIVVSIFATVLLLMLFLHRKAQKIKQFNIAFSAERPYRPETTHYAWNFYAPYRKALGILTEPVIERFWAAIMDLLHGTSEIFRRLYTGNGQTYVTHFIAFVAIVFLFSVGV